MKIKRIDLQQDMKFEISFSLEEVSYIKDALKEQINEIIEASSFRTFDTFLQKLLEALK